MADKRFAENWMALTQEEINSLDNESWKDYKNGKCLCFAFCECECICGAKNK